MAGRGVWEGGGEARFSSPGHDSRQGGDRSLEAPQKYTLVDQIISLIGRCSRTGSGCYWVVKLLMDPMRRSDRQWPVAATRDTDGWRAQGSGLAGHARRGRSFVLACQATGNALRSCLQLLSHHVLWR